MPLFPFNPVKTFAETTLQFLIKRYGIAKIGKVSGLDVRIEQREFAFALELNGEIEAIHITLGYSKLPENKIELICVSASREWIKTVINEIIPAEKRRVEVPGLVFPLL